MRRRQPRQTDATPERLVRFVATEWPGEPDVWHALKAWKTARWEWTGAHPVSLLGDFVDMLKLEHDTRVALWRSAGPDTTDPWR